MFYPHQNLPVPKSNQTINLKMVWNSNYKVFINRAPLEIYTAFLSKPVEWPVWDTDLSKVDFDQEFGNGAKGKV